MQQHSPSPQVLHERDARVCIMQRPRCVLVDGAPLHFAATSLSSKYVDPFDAKATVAHMIERGPWPAAGYAIAPTEVPSDGALDLTRPTQVLRAADGIAVHVAQKGVSAETLHLLFGDDLRFVQFQRAMTAPEVLSHWETKADDARVTGISAHARIEEWLKREMLTDTSPNLTPTQPPGPDTPEAAVAEFMRTQLAPLGARIVATEWCVFDETASVVATIDAIARFPDGTYALIDWKHTRALRDRFCAPRRMRAPLAHLPDCDVVRYTLQLSVYAQILARQYAMAVTCLVLVNTHATDKTWTDVPYLRDEASLLLEEHATDVRARAAGVEPVCAVDNRLALDPVRCTDGKVRCRRKAQAAGMRYRVDPDLAARARETLDGARTASTRERVLTRVLERAVDWEKLMPPGGVQTLNPGFGNFLKAYW